MKYHLFKSTLRGTLHSEMKRGNPIHAVSAQGRQKGPYEVDFSLGNNSSQIFIVFMDTPRKARVDAHIYCREYGTQNLTDRIPQMIP